MLKSFIVTVVVSVIAFSATEAFAGHRRCSNGYYYAPAPAVAPAPSPAPMAQAPQDNRTFSYQPTQTDYRAYGSWVSGRTGRAYENAANKSLGRGF
jgi:hypothetical protein